MEHVIATQTVVDDERLALSGLSGERYGAVGDCRGLKKEVAGADVHLLGHERVVEALVLTAEERHATEVVALAGLVGNVVTHIAPATLLVLDVSLCDSTSLGREGDGQLGVLQHHVLRLAREGLVEEGCGVGRHLFLGGLLLLVSGNLGGLVGLLLGHLLQ